MPGTFSYDQPTNTIEVTDGTSGAPATFNDMYMADMAGTLTVLDAGVIDADPDTFSLGVALQAADSKQMKLTISASADRALALMTITGTDLDGETIVETDIDIATANATPVVTDLKFAVVDDSGISVSGMTNGDTITITQPRWGVIEASLGDELVTNGGFSADSAWTKEAVWTIAGGVANGNGAAGGAEELVQGIGHTLGRVHILQYTISGIAGGETLDAYLGEDGGSFTRSTNGTFVEYLLPAVETWGLRFTGHAVNGFSGTLDNVSVREVLPQWTIHCNVDFGDDATATYFTSLNEFVWFPDGNTFHVYSNVTLQLGELNGGTYGINGSCWRFNGGSNLCDYDATSQILMYDSYWQLYGNPGINGQHDIRNSIFSGTIFQHASGTSVWRRVNVCDGGAFILLVTPTTMEDILVHDLTANGLQFQATPTLSNIIFDNNTQDVIVIPAGTGTLTNPTNFSPPPAITDAAGALVEQYTCNIHVTDKDGADLQSVDVDCQYAHLVEGSDAKTYKCIQDCTSVDAVHKPITGSDWESFFELFDAGGGLGGDWQTTYDFKSGTTEFATQTTNADGDITEQVVQYKKWVGTSELLEARIHKFTLTKAGYKPLMLDDRIVSIPAVWTFEMPEAVGAFVEAWR